MVSVYTTEMDKYLTRVYDGLAQVNRLSRFPLHSGRVLAYNALPTSNPTPARLFQGGEYQ
ncbi:hypothetical protein GMSM_08260 [Geomonas sp. Red276]